MKDLESRPSTRPAFHVSDVPSRYYLQYVPKKIEISILLYRWHTEYTEGFDCRHTLVIPNVSDGPTGITIMASTTRIILPVVLFLLLGFFSILPGKIEKLILNSCLTFGRAKVLGIPAHFIDLCLKLTM